MTHIFIEAAKEKTVEYVFLNFIISTKLSKPKGSYIIHPVDGWTNLYNVTNTNLMQQAMINKEKVIIVCDADLSSDKSNYGGFEERKRFIENQLSTKNLSVPIFLSPNNHDDGDIECLLDLLTQKEEHGLFFDCYNDFEACLGDNYEHPNLKNKLIMYMRGQKLSAKQRKGIGNGDWMFGDERYWDLSNSELTPLLSFLDAHIDNV